MLYYCQCHAKLDSIYPVFSAPRAHHMNSSAARSVRIEIKMVRRAAENGMRHKTYANQRLKSVGGGGAGAECVFIRRSLSSSRTTQFPYTFPIVKETMSYKLNWEILALLFRGIATINTEKPLYQPTTIDLLKTLHFCVWALALCARRSIPLGWATAGSVNGALLCAAFLPVYSAPLCALLHNNTPTYSSPLL
jgi:hypothetical protein